MLCIHPTDEDVAAETELYQRELKSLDERNRPPRPAHHNNRDAATESGVTDNMRDMQLKRRRDERRAKRAKAKPQNLLFGVGDDDAAAAAGSSSSADDETDGNETEEENEAEKKLKSKETPASVGKRAKVAE